MYSVIFGTDSSFLSLTDYAEEVQPGPDCSPAPRHTSFLCVTERGGDAKSVTAPVSQITVEGKREEKKPIHPDCYKHFMPRYKMSALDPVHIMVSFFAFCIETLLFIYLYDLFLLLNDYKMLILCSSKQR